MGETTMIETMIEQFYEQRIAQLEFRIETLEKAVLAMAKNLGRLEGLYSMGAKRLLDDIFKEEEESKQ
jgi:hypothetical protein